MKSLLFFSLVLAAGVAGAASDSPVVPADAGTNAAVSPVAPVAVAATGAVAAVAPVAGVAAGAVGTAGVGAVAGRAGSEQPSSGVAGPVARAGRTNAVSTALGGGGTNQTVITSRQLLFDYKRSVAMFEGDVVVNDPQMKITSDRLLVFFGPSNEVQTVTALDDVRIFSADRQGTCDRAIYKVPAGEIILTGSPVLRREKDVLKGDMITFWTDREVVVCEPGQLVLSPESVKEKK